MDHVAMNADMIVFRAYSFYQTAKERNECKIAYVKVRHTGPNCSNPCVINMPRVCLPLDHRGACFALRDYADPQAIIGRCRCGYVCQSIFFTCADHGNRKRVVALKVMDKTLVEIEKDDIENEVRIMAQLQTWGLDSPQGSRHILRWESVDCPLNHYIATEYVANGALSAFMHSTYDKAYKNIKLQTKDNVSPNDLGKTVGYWFMHQVALPLFGSILQGLVYLHTQNVCHLDIDPYNIAVGGTAPHFEAKFIDFGSSQLLDHRMRVGAGPVTPAIKAKVTYRSPELKENARKRSEYLNYLRKHRNSTNLAEEQAKVPKGFDGRLADIYSTGVVGFEMMMYAFRFEACNGSSFVSNANAKWHSSVMDHNENKCTHLTCLFCMHDIKIPQFAWSILVQMIDLDESKRGTAFELVQAWQRGLRKFNEEFQGFRRVPQGCNVVAYEHLTAAFAQAA